MRVQRQAFDVLKNTQAKSPAIASIGLGQQAAANKSRVPPQIALMLETLGCLFEFKLLGRVGVFAIWQAEQKSRQDQAEVGRFRQSAQGVPGGIAFRVAFQVPVSR